MYSVVSIRNIISIDSSNSYGVCVFDLCFCSDWLVYCRVKLDGSFFVNCFIFVMVWLVDMLEVGVLDRFNVGKLR